MPKGGVLTHLKLKQLQTANISKYNNVAFIFIFAA